MKLKLSDIARDLDAVLDGDPHQTISGVAGLAEAGPNELSFFANPKFQELVAGSKAGAILVPRDFHGHTQGAKLRVDDPYLGFIQIVRRLRAEDMKREEGIHPTALVDDSAEVGKGASIGAFCVVEEGTKIGDGVTLSPGVFVGKRGSIGAGSYLYPNVTVLEGVVVGERVIVHSGSVLGSDGFGYLLRNSSHEKVPQVGTVVIEDDVEIGANTAIDRATLGCTRICRGVKIDNLVHIAHNVTVGENTLVVAQVGISGSTKVGQQVTLGGQAGVAGHLEIGDGVMVGAKGGVTKPIAPGAVVSGFPAMDHNRARRLNAYYRKLPEFFDKLRRLEERVRELTGEKERIP